MQKPLKIEVTVLEPLIADPELGGVIVELKSSVDGTIKRKHLVQYNKPTKIAYSVDKGIY